MQNTKDDECRTLRPMRMRYKRAIMDRNSGKPTLHLLSVEHIPIRNCYIHRGWSSLLLVSLARISTSIERLRQEAILAQFPLAGVQLGSKQTAEIAALVRAPQLCRN